MLTLARTSVGVTVALLVLNTLSIQAGIDRLVTINSWSKPLSILIGVAAALATGGGVALSGASFKSSGSKVQRAFGALVLGALAAWLVVRSLGVAAQHLRGSLITRSAVVTSVRTYYVRRGPCERYVALAFDSNEQHDLCLSTRFRGSLASATLSAGMPVSIRLRDTIFGDVVESIEPAQ